MRNIAARLNVIAACAGMTMLLGSCVTPEPSTAPRPPVARAFDPALVQRGAVLAALGNCRGCHTRADGKSFAGGVPFRTQFGTVYSTNITPDDETGMGRWSEADFTRAMREGVDRGGRNLYPVFPYDHFTHVTDEDDRAIYAYLMTRPAVKERARHNEMMFPFNLRATIGLWKSRYFKPGPGRFATRGEYLVEGLGHCGSCHTPRNAAGAERPGERFNGGEAEGWHAYAINERSESPVPWTVAAMTAYFKQGFHPDHGISRGPMALVTDELADVPEADLREMSTYIVSLMPKAPRGMPAGGAAVPQNGGAELYASVCASCHDGSQPLPFGGMTLPLSMGVAGESPLNLANVILYGLAPADGATAPLMPGFEGALSDAQIVQLASWMRARFAHKPPWKDLEGAVRKARREGREGARFPAGGSGSDPAAVAQQTR